MFNVIKQLNLKIYLKYQKSLKADAMITGHYVKSITYKNETSMYRAIDENRDQKLFLFNTIIEILLMDKEENKSF